MEIVPNHMTLGSPFPEGDDYNDEPETDDRPTFDFIDGSRIILQKFDDPIVVLPTGKAYLTASCARIARNTILEAGMGNEEAEKYITNLFQYKP